MAEVHAGPPEDRAGSDDRADDLVRAREAGWTERSAFDYDYYSRTTNDGSTGDWAGAARVYEWRDEYGEVAPAVPELESILFKGDLRGGQGEHLENLDLEVTLEGPMRVAPVLKVSICILRHHLLSSH